MESPELDEGQYPLVAIELGGPIGQPSNSPSRDTSGRLNVGVDQANYEPSA